MKIDAFIHHIIDPGLAALARLGGPPPSDEARVFLLAVAQQEIGAGLAARYQSSPSASPGPARGRWQFEQGGGVKGVMTHPASTVLAKALCATYEIAWNQPAVWRALEGHDFLAVGFARLLLFTDPYKIPTEQTPAWDCYNLRLWRPGKPHPEAWPDNWLRAQQAVMG